MAIEAIAVDIDGTITDDKRQICISAIEALRKAEKAGIPTIIVTGNVVNYDTHASHDNMYRLTETVFYKTLARKDLEDALEDFEYRDRLEIYDSGFALHVTDRRVNKGTSLRYLCERNGIDMENVMAIGDSQNDEDFLKEVGYKIAVGNADEKLKEISTYTCEKMFGDGVAEAIEKFAL